MERGNGEHWEGSGQGGERSSGQENGGVGAARGER